MKRTRILFLTSALGCVLLTSNASAAIVIFQAVWSGESFKNNASAVGLIGIDTAVIPNPGSYYESGAMPVWLDSISITVTGAASGNGTFETADFAGIAWSTGSLALDLTTELVGQPTGGAPWGTGMDGDLNFFNAFDSGAPRGTSPFELSTNEGGGDPMHLISFAPYNFSPIPEPSTYLFGSLFCGLAAFVVWHRRLQAKRASV